MDIFIAHQLEKTLKDNNKKKYTIPLNSLNSNTTYKHKSCPKCGQNLYFCQCYNNSYINGTTKKHNLSNS